VSAGKCPGCGEPFRKGRKALLLLPTGELEPRRVCGDCASKVALRIVPIQPRGRSECELFTDTARFCHEHRGRPVVLSDLRSRLVTFRRIAESSIGRESGRMVEGKLEGLDQAIGLVDALLEGRPL